MHTPSRLASRRRVRVLALVAALVATPIGHASLGAQAVSSAIVESSAPSLAMASRGARRADAELDAAARRYAAAVRHCYEERGLKEDPMLRGRLRVAMTVLPEGDVRAPAVTATEAHGLGMSAVAACVTDAARSWRFADGAARAERVVLWFDLVPSTA